MATSAHAQPVAGTSQETQYILVLTVCRYAEYRFVLVDKTKSAKNIWEPVFEDVIILDFLMADTSSKRQKNIHILENMSHFYLILRKIIFAYMKISRESHFHLQVIAHVHPRIIFSMHRTSVRNTGFRFVSKPR